MSVSYEKSRDKFRVTVKENGRTKHIGRYNTRAEADHRLADYRREQKMSSHLIYLKNQPKIINIRDYPEFDIYTPIGEEKPSLWDKIKSVWRNIKPQN